MPDYQKSANKMTSKETSVGLSSSHTKAADIDLNTLVKK